MKFHKFNSRNEKDRPSSTQLTAHHTRWLLDTFYYFKSRINGYINGALSTQSYVNWTDVFVFEEMEHVKFFYFVLVRTARSNLLIISENNI